MKIPFKHILIILLLGTVSLFLHRKEINDFPQHIHAWAQSDYYAISLGFIDNGFDFFHPQTYTQNPQFPDGFLTPKENGITSADFPIHTYSVALLMKLTGYDSPWVFRMYTLFFSIVGLFFLFLLIKELDGSDLKALFGVSMVLLSPVYLYYRAGFLPSIPSLSFVIIAYYYYVKHLKFQKNKYFKRALLFFTLATLARTPFAIFLIAVTAQEVLYFIINKKVKLNKVIVLFVSFAVIIGYFVYNLVLREKYGSIFLNSPLPPSSWKEAKELIAISLESWKWHYLTKWHYLIVFLGIIFSIIQYLKNRKIASIHKLLLVQLSIVSTGVLMYSFLMLNQFVNHDYYFIDTFFTPFILITVFVLSFVNSEKLIYLFIGFIFIGFSTKEMVRHSLDAQKQRKENANWGYTSITTANFTNGDLLLKQLNIPKEAKILIIDAVAPNIPFLLLKRSGYTVHHLTAENLTNALTWNYDYIAIQDYNIIRITETYPTLSSKIKRIGGNRALSIYSLKKETTANVNVNVRKLLQLDKETPHYTSNFKKNSEWRENQLFTSSSLLINPETEFSYTLEIENTNELLTKSNLAIVQLSIENKKELKGGLLVFNVSEEGENKSYQAEKIKLGSNSYLFNTPLLHKPDNKISLYIWNNKKDSILVKDFEIEIY